MDSIRIRGGHPLNGTLRISGAKNAALPLMAASLLTDEPVILDNLPRLTDIGTMEQLLIQHGVVVKANGDGTDTSHEFNAAEVDNYTAPYDLVRRMRASVLVLGPLLARFGEAHVSLPGGCAIGTRPVDLHLKALEELGAEIELEGGYITARAPKGLHGASVVFPFVSVGATENLLMAAALAEGETVLENAAREPEVSDLAHMLQAMGARIDGIGTPTLRIQGAPRLHGVRHAVVADRIETGTYMIAAAITRGRLTIDNTRPALVDSLTRALQEAGVAVSESENAVIVDARDREVLGVDVMTEPYPGFPTDLQAQFMALMTTARGASLITETIFENRFMHVPELSRMGARINIHGGASAIVRGVSRLSGAPVMATDLRASVSLVLAGLAAEGETLVNRVYHLDRGYERVEEKLGACGADITRVPAQEEAAE